MGHVRAFRDAGYTAPGTFILSQGEDPRGVPGRRDPRALCRSRRGASARRGDGPPGGPVVGVPVVTTRTWNGAGLTANWSAGANWIGGVAPVAGDGLIFPASATSKISVNDLSGSPAFDSIQIAGSGYTFSGNAIRVHYGITATYAGSDQAFPLDIGLTRAQTFSVTQATGSLTLTGKISGSYALTKTGSGQLKLSGDNSGLSGALTVSGDRLYVNTASAPGTGAVTVGSGSSLVINASGANTFTNAISLSGYGVSGSGAVQNDAGDNVRSGRSRRPRAPASACGAAACRSRRSPRAPSACARAGRGRWRSPAHPTTTGPSRSPTGICASPGR